MLIPSLLRTACAILGLHCRLLGDKGGSGVTNDAAGVMVKLKVDYVQTVLSGLRRTGCTSKNIAVRQEWDSLSEAQRLDYVRAVQCLHAKEPKQPGGLAHNRLEEFIIPHVNQTLEIHASKKGLLLPWHRYFLHLYETALREECGYKGYLPYWDWPKYIENPQKSTIFDGSAASLSGNGAPIPHGEYRMPVPGGPPPVQFFTRAAGEGGGCVSGPFENLTLYLDASNEGATTPAKLTQNPRCLKRDFYMPILAQQNSYENVTNLILNSPNMETFNRVVESDDGVHVGGHFYYGPEQLNLFTSPGDPAFFLHHAMLDRVWAIWQSRDPRNRRDALSGTVTFENYPPSENVTLDHTLRIDVSGDFVKIKQVMSTTENILCYIYG
ncbi:Tyrosinase-like protein orsC [Metarhizium anisopliae]